MSGPEISNYSMPTGVNAPAPVESIPTESTGGSQGLSGVSSIEKSKTVIIEAPPSADIPQLPNYNNDVMMSSLLMSQNLSADKITSEMLDAWGKSIAEQKRYVEEMLNSPQYRLMQEIQMKGNDSTATDQAHNSLDKPLIINVSDRLNGYLSKVGQSENAPVDITAAPVVTSVLALGATMVVAVDPTALIPSSANSPLASITQISSYMEPILPSSVLLADTVQTINLMVMPMLYQVSWDTAVGKTKAQKSDAECATKFAQEIIKMTTTPELIQYRVIDQMNGASKLSGKEREQLAAVIKLTLCITAIAFLYKTETGGMTSKEILDRVMGMIQGTVPVKAGSEEAVLARIVQAQLQILDPEAKAIALEAIMAYLDSSPKLEKDLKKMTDPLHTFESVLQNLHFSHDATDLTPV